MGKANMTFEQNIAGARMFLNLFDLKLDTSKGISETVPIRIIDSENNTVGFVSVEDGKIMIDCDSALGVVTAEYPFGQMTGFKDLECGGYFAEWRHPITFNIQGERNIQGNMLFDVKMDSDMGNHCRIHTTMTYQDPDGKDVEMKIMEGGRVFSYKTNYKSPQYDFTEILTIDPWEDSDSYLYHHLISGKKNRRMGGNIKESLYFVWKNGDNQLRGVRSLVNAFRTTDYKEELRKRKGKEDSKESTIQKGLLMHEMDPGLAKKMEWILQSFQQNGVSFLDNLLDASYSRLSEEERLALFGTTISKIQYHNGADNILDAYFGTGDNNQFEPKVVYQKVTQD